VGRRQVLARSAVPLVALAIVVGAGASSARAKVPSDLQTAVSAYVQDLGKLESMAPAAVEGLNLAATTCTKLKDAGDPALAQATRIFANRFSADLTEIQAWVRSLIVGGNGIDRVFARHWAESILNEFNERDHEVIDALNGMTGGVRDAVKALYAGDCSGATAAHSKVAKARDQLKTAGNKIRAFFSSLGARV